MSEAGAKLERRLHAEKLLALPDPEAIWDVLVGLDQPAQSESCGDNSKVRCRRLEDIETHRPERQSPNSGQARNVFPTSSPQQAATPCRAGSPATTTET